ncbi:Golgi-associated kinase 1B [Brachyhypopomus gauderio]|uniref:Golgi-associated kinase 1B n=1 Tax=Brachyhypopomus gauderio TaxID=698409 RepID=UPI00404129C7
MEKRPIRLGNIGYALTRLLCSSFLRVSNCCWRYPKARRSLIIAGACFVYLVFAVHYVSNTSDHQNRRSEYWTGNGVFSMRNGVFSMRKHSSESVDEFWEPNGSPTPARSNVVYITLKSKRHKPAVLRGTVRPKLRRKNFRKPKKQVAQTYDGPKEKPTKGEWEQKRTDARDTWKQIIRNAQSFYKTKQLEDDNRVSSIRIYSQMVPPWFSKEDIANMRFLADSKITHVKSLEPKGSPPVLLFNSARRFDETLHRNPDNANECSGYCGVIKRPVDMSEVFAFHLDRVLGLNRSLPTVSRRFRVFGGQLCPVSLWEAAVKPVSVEPSGSLTWAQYQAQLRHGCWLRGAPRPEWNCTGVHHHEWSRLALFDFLLQIHQRLDRNCCGFRPRSEDSCVELGYHGECADMDRVELSHIVHRTQDPKHLVFINNKGFFDRDEDNLDFKLLEGIKELPDGAVGVLSSQRLRERLLQSLFLDELYWESQGGRQGVEKLIDVIERRARVLLRYINAHDIKIIPMNT